VDSFALNLKALRFFKSSATFYQTDIHSVTFQKTSTFISSTIKQPTTHDSFRTHLSSPIREEDNFFRDLVNFTHTVIFSKQYLICNRICAYCMGHPLLETLQCENWGKYRAVSYNTLLPYPFFIWILTINGNFNRLTYNKFAGFWVFKWPLCLTSSLYTNRKD
jgi:hypothetical protein